MFCVTANAVSLLENRHFRSHRPPIYDGSEILCVDKIRSRPRGHLCVGKTMKLWTFSESAVYQSKFDHSS